jgi:hypothetical protein
MAAPVFTPHHIGRAATMCKLAVVILAISLAANIALLLERQQTQNYHSRRPHVKEYEQPYADMALKAHAAENFKSIRDGEDYIYPVAISLEDKVCIQLKIVVGVLGEPRTYCYRKDTKEAVPFK